jgi:cell division protein FtsB
MEIKMETTALINTMNSLSVSDRIQLLRVITELNAEIEKLKADLAALDARVVVLETAP